MGGIERPFFGPTTVVRRDAQAEVPGDVDLTSGFLFSGTDLVSEQALGRLKTKNWITKAHYMPDVPSASQPSPDGNTNNDGNHLLGVQADTFYRNDGFGRTPKVTDFGYWSGGSDGVTAAGNPTVGAFNHVALVWDASSNSLSASLNGVLQNTASTGSAFDGSSPNVGYGFFSRFLNRAVNGNYDAVAFSIFTGDFDAASHFQRPVVPEPGFIAIASVPEPTTCSLVIIAASLAFS